MKAIAVVPGQPESVHLADLTKPSVSDVPGGRGVLVKVLRVGVDGTDREINAAEYGRAPEGFDFLVIGHESFGRVESVGPNVSFLRPGDFVVATVRRPGRSIYDSIGLQDMSGAILSHLLILGIEVKGDGGLLFGLAVTALAGSAIVLFLRRAQVPVLRRFLPA